MKVIDHTYVASGINNLAHVSTIFRNIF